MTPSHSRSNLWRPSLVLALLTLLGFGLLYSLAATGIGHVLFPVQATGSLREREGRIVGSGLVAQPFVDDRYFRPRPSAVGYNAMALAGSNDARTNPTLRTRIDAARAVVATREGVSIASVPSDLVTASGSGIDPHLSPAAIHLQVDRVARARGMARTDVERLVTQHTESRVLGLFGEPRINVLVLNLALDDAASGSGSGAH